VTRSILRCRGARLTAIAAAALAVVFPAPAGADSPPAVQAAAAIVVEPQSGDIVFQRRAEERRSIASTTKLMTALIALERLALDDVLTAVPYRALPGESVLGLREGERVRVSDLLRAVLLASGNDAAATLAVDIAGSESAFVRLMNQRAQRLGLRNTHFSNPIGLDAAGNYSSASDLVKLTLILRRSAFFRRTVDLPRATIGSGGEQRTVVNRNVLLEQVPYLNGVKTGHTIQAGYVLVGSAARAGVTMISVVLGEPSEASRDSDTLELLRYGLGRYRAVRAAVRGRQMARVKLRYRDEHVPLVAGADVVRTVRRGEGLQVRLMGIPDEIEGPLPGGSRAGTIEVRRRGRVVARAPLVLARDLDATPLYDRLVSYAGRPMTVVLVVVLAICSLQLALLRRRAERRRRRRGQAELA
jgi:serine-type D-Ala-D-Ala carboxypeptidase (penicillin-binding protein 5/6)